MTRVEGELQPTASRPAARSVAVAAGSGGMAAVLVQEGRPRGHRGFAGTDAGGEKPAGAGCPVLTDPCLLCIGVSCGAEYGACQADQGCASAMNLATACLCEAQALGNPVDPCMTGLEARGGPATAFTACLGTRCPLRHVVAGRGTLAPQAFRATNRRRT